MDLSAPSSGGQDARRWGPPVVTLVGPTAAGKSALGVALALELGAEIVSTDSMALYRGMDIGTATPDETERGTVPHHLLDVWDVTRSANVAEFQALARAAVDDVRRRGLPVVVVGGSGLYVSALLEPLEFPGTDPDVRATLEADLAAFGPAVMHERLTQVDPVAAAAILPGNGRRIVRALEVVTITGRPYQAHLPVSDPVFAPEVRIGLDVPRDVLDVRIAARVDRMWREGLLDEVGALLAQGLREGVTASQALGYRQAVDQLDGLLDEDEAKAATVEATSRFARRQQRWFRRDRGVHWIPFDAPDLLAQARALVPAGTPAG